MFRKLFGVPRVDELSTYVGGGGFLALLSAFLAPDQAEAIVTITIGVMALLSTFQKEKPE